MRGADSIRGLRDEDLDGAAPYVPVEMVETLKFSAALPPEMAARTLAERFADRAGARATRHGPGFRVRVVFEAVTCGCG